MKTRNTAQTQNGCQYHSGPESCENQIRKARKKAVAVMCCLLAVLAFAMWATSWGEHKHRHTHQLAPAVVETDGTTYTYTARVTLSCPAHAHYIPFWRALPFTSHSHSKDDC